MHVIIRLTILVSVLLLPSLLSARGRADVSPTPPAPPAPKATPAPTASDRRAEREEMVRTQIAGRGIRDESVLRAMRKVPRHLFVPETLLASAYDDTPLPIGHGQTISQPYIVAFMSEALALKAGERVLEIGTGSGYQAAVLAEITSNVYTIEIVAPLAASAATRLAVLGYTSIRTKAGDGYYGWEDAGPFDAIIVTAAAGHVPPPLVKQLAPGGRLIIPVGGVYEVQTLVLVTKDATGAVQPPRELLPVRFVPLTGAGQ
jgi:protein-L-isoaspartate(D-aspartate) O-methyltransferase